MGRPEQPLEPIAGPLTEFARELRELRQAAGDPGYRTLARRAGYSASTLSSAASGRTLPSLAVTLAYAGACGGEAAEWERRWERAAATADASAPRQLPPGPDGFVGRAAELAALDRLLDAASREVSAVVIAAVTGTGGAGKTALARHWAHRVAARFPDGLLHAELRGSRPDRWVASGEVLAAFLRALGVPGREIPDDPAERAARYRTLVAGQRMLVLLDDARSAEHVRPLLPGTPSCFVLVTSRDGLAGLVARHGARRLHLDRVRRPALLGG